MTLQHAIIVAGKPVACTVPVRTWHDTGMHFVTRMRGVPPRWVINHWTASENSAEQVYRGMRDRKDALGRPDPVSVHFLVDQLGAAFQLADAEARCAHCRAGDGNTYGVGIEIVNRGHGSAPSKGFERTPVTERVHGQLVRYGAFFPAQVQTVIALNRAICAAYQLPMRCPIGPDGDVLATVMPDAVRERFRGCGGHYQWEKGKVDPAPDLLRRIHEAGMVG